MANKEEYIEVYGAREHNLKNIDVKIPRNSLVVLTGISGSGKSSLAFDTIYAEGQRRYMETFSAYARGFLGNMERPDVDKITGLSPVISIEQKTTSKNPRSTVGTTTEIYDYLRLLFARAADAYSYVSGKKMQRQSEEQVLEILLNQFNNQKISILSPMVKARKGHYRELFEQIAKAGYLKVRVDGVVMEIQPKMQVDRYKTHDIEVVIDRLLVSQNDRERISQSLSVAMKLGKGMVMVLDEDAKIHYYSKILVDPENGISYEEPAPNMFSFNSPYGACPTCNGLGTVEEVTEESLIPDSNLSIRAGGIAPLGEQKNNWMFNHINALLKHFGFNISTPIKNLPQEIMDYIIHGVESGKLSNGVYDYLKKNNLPAFEGIINFVKSHQNSESDKMREWVSQFTAPKTCPSCKGARLKKESLFFKLGDKNIAELAQMQLPDLNHFFYKLPEQLSPTQKAIATEVLKEISKRLNLLIEVGLDYLTLDRAMKTLSGGEAQRIRLATQIGTQLVGVLYILDEPSIGLHQRDNVKLIKALHDLRDLGNTVLVVEHDKDMMLESDYVIDVGPGAGRHGGNIVAEGKPEDFVKFSTTTSKYLSGDLGFPVPEKRREGNGNYIKLLGCKGNNLKNVNFNLPLGKLVCVTGVSGSGKSTLIHDTLFPLLNRHFFHAKRQAMPYDELLGLEYIDKVIEVDQSPIGRTPRSNPVTYTGVFTEIRNLFAQLPEAKIRGYELGRFSFNVKGGRCEECEGGGVKVISMDFLPDVHVQCTSCKGKRYNRETLEVRFKGKSISDVLDMSVETAMHFFESQPKILRKIQTLYEVGLGYITLGQHATTLSGGEAQRVKLATELSKKDTGKTLYILDEPTTGLHFDDIKKLMDILNKLVDKGNTVLIIEHNLDVIKMADHIIDLGPEGGKGGGVIVCEGTPEKVAKNKSSHTARFLAQELKNSEKVAV
ncbi:MAG: excinuclease ABC subunit UvrA [Cytophagales bacterium]